MANEILYGGTRNLERSIDFIRNTLSGREQVKRYLRNELINQGLIKPLPQGTSRLTVVEGIDGSYKAHRTLAFQILAFGVVGYAPSHANPNKKLRHFVMAIPTLMSDFSQTILKGITTLYEFAMAYTSDANLVIMDGSLIAFLTSLNNFYAKISQYPNDPAAAAVRDLIDPTSSNPHNVYKFTGSTRFLIKTLESNITPNTSKYIVSIPKGSGTSSALEYILDNVITLSNPPTIGGLSFKDYLKSHYTDRMLFTIILGSDEYFYYYTNQKALTKNKHEANLARNAGDLRPQDADDVEKFYDSEGTYSRMGGFTFVFYRPHSWAPAYKIEIPGKVSTSTIEEILLRLKESVVDPSIAEHYEQYMADRIVKTVAKSTKAIVGASMTSLSQVLGPDIVRLLLSSYRTER
ncbi:MAG: hypothetical protein ACP5IE_06620 [Infirmifilum sp.]